MRCPRVVLLAWTAVAAGLALPPTAAANPAADALPSTSLDAELARLELAQLLDSYTADSERPGRRSRDAPSHLLLGALGEDGSLLLAVDPRGGLFAGELRRGKLRRQRPLVRRDVATRARAVRVVLAARAAATAMVDSELRSRIHWRMPLHAEEPRVETPAP